MGHFHFQSGELFVERVSATNIAEQFDTPCYVYSKATFETNYNRFKAPWRDHPHRICYSVKANSNIAILNLLARLGAGFDIVSGGELARVLQAGGDVSSVVFSGVGKQAAEMQQALDANIHCFNVESSSELELLNQLAGDAGKTANISVRINPDVDPLTHEYIATGLKENKFGVNSDQVIEVYRRAAALAHINVAGIDCHIGSQLTELSPFLNAMQETLKLVDLLSTEGIELGHINMGGGLGVRYRQENPPAIEEYAAGLLQLLGSRELELVFEPGRYIAADAGILLTRVNYLKDNHDKHFAVVDAAMNDLIRPALYQAWQQVTSVRSNSAQAREYDIVGPICESGDFLAKDRSLQLEPGDLIAVECAGAYGFVMSSNYNSRNRAAEVMVDGDQVHLIRKRETIENQLALENLLPP
ncbi:MAG: diaminopimelate decarboxylase [Pseudomonadales bacterium]|jgi:diaminopimelate decarboxylase|nr:diaminopimelate decarboxylase [Pseudomonadales bacterium]MDP7146200.1 diaminopimelate decarboxylase [Pseudomonadales bacterium]MDP7360539.1 diaminopimelate decarboxylase [Pseudomonadales bacterium]MDP7598010.1 diaminopimelate decarboxylase [Pseudomonadales bacterium]HJN49357.1 diaminopimelate decarboxylase [Pseudomonadales bacterium]|tara:strand:+ start:7880 stop:9127 length:1248 start_codon:yes stop_codon:yes gene_type:complete